MVDDKTGPDRKVTDWFRDAWAQALVAVGNAEVEAGKVAQRVSDLAGWGPEDAKRMAKELGDRLTSQRKELDDGLNRALGRVKIPKREDIEALAKRLARVADRMDALEAKRK